MLAWLVLVGCPKAPVAAPPTPDSAPAPAGGPWQSAVLADHPLVGRIWDSGAGRFASEDELVADLRQADFVLLGEKHDNPDHHRLQARLIEALAPKACVFEMLDHADPVAGASDPDALAAAVDWAHSGWPEFELYRPVFAACYAVGAAVVPGHPTRDEVKAAMSQGIEALPAEATAGLPLDRPLDEAQRGALAEEIVRSHCGHASPELVEKMIVGQVLKDATMARALARAAAPAVLVAGGGHTRVDRGVPSYLGGTRTVQWVEVDPGRPNPADYEDEGGDWLWFTPAVDDEDPCVAFAEQLKKMAPPAAPAPPEPPAAPEPPPVPPAPPAP